MQTIRLALVCFFLVAAALIFTSIQVPAGPQTGGATAGSNDTAAQSKIASAGRMVSVNTSGLLSSPTGRVYPTIQNYTVGVEDSERAEALVRARPELQPEKVGEVKISVWPKVISAADCKEINLLEGEVRPGPSLSGGDIR